MASIWPVNDNTSAEDDAPDEDDVSTRFEAIAAETLRICPALQRSDLYTALLATATTTRMPSPIIRTNDLLLPNSSKHPNILYAIAILVVSVTLAILVIQPFVAYVLGIRCFIPNNYLVWEATRPISDCAYCRDVKRPLILPNMTREQFLVYITHIFV